MSLVENSWDLDHIWPHIFFSSPGSVHPPSVMKQGLKTHACANNALKHLEYVKC